MSQPPTRPSGRVGATVLLAASLAFAPVLQAGDGSTRDAMANAMARMMDAMGLFDSGKPDSGMPFNPGSYMAPGMGMGPFSQFGGQNPWSSFMTNPGQGFGMDRWLQQMPGLSAWQRTTLEGIWEGRDGGLLIVQGRRFRLYSPHGGYVEGLIQQRGDRIALYDPQSETARPYEFAEQQGRLVLRDANGQVYLYRRLWLDADDPVGSAATQR